MTKKTENTGMAPKIGPSVDQPVPRKRGRQRKPPGTSRAELMTAIIQVRIEPAEKQKLESYGRVFKMSNSDIMRGFIAQLPGDAAGAYDTIPVKLNGHRMLISKENAISLIKQLADELSKLYPT